MHHKHGLKRRNRWNKQFKEHRIIKELVHNFNCVATVVHQKEIRSNTNNVQLANNAFIVAEIVK